MVEGKSFMAQIAQWFMGSLLVVLIDPVVDALPNLAKPKGRREKADRTEPGVQGFEDGSWS
jgi:hypothetical protein